MIPDEQVIGIIIPLLKNNALQLMKEYTEANIEPYSWKAFVKILRENHKPRRLKKKLMADIRSLRYNGNINEFNDKFSELAKQLIYVPDDILIEWYFDIIPSDMRKVVFHNDPQTLAEAFKEAAIHEEYNKYDKKLRGYSNNLNNQTMSVNYSRVQYQKPFKKFNGQNKFKGKFQGRSNFKFNNRDNQYKQNGFNENRFKTNNNDKPRSFNFQSNQRMDNKVKNCFKCNKPGHFAKDCRVTKLHKVNNVNEIINEIESNDEHENRIVKILCLATDDASILGTNGTIGGVSMNVSFDSGATASIMSRKIVDKYEFKIIPTNIKIKTADNTKSKVDGITETLVVDICNHSCVIELIIINHDDHDV